MLGAGLAKSRLAMKMTLGKCRSLPETRVSRSAGRSAHITALL